MQGIGGHRMDARGNRSDAGLQVVTNAFVEAACYIVSWEMRL